MLRVQDSVVSGLGWVQGWGFGIELFTGFGLRL